MEREEERAKRTVAESRRSHDEAKAGQRERDKAVERTRMRERMKRKRCIS